MHGLSFGAYAASGATPEAFDPSSIAGLVADLSVATARTPTGTDYAASFATAGSDYLSSSSNAIRTDPTNGLTVCFWMKYVSGTFPCACEGSGGWRMDFGAGGGRFLVWSAAGGLIGNIDLGTTNPTANQWVFFVLQVDPGLGKCRIRKNRQAWVEGSLSGTPGAGTSDTLFGALSPGSGFVGSIGSVLIAQTVLSEAEIDEAFGAPGGATYAGLTPGLRAKVAEFWGMAESSGDRAGSKSSIALAVNGTVARVAGPAHAAPIATGDPIAWWISGSPGRVDVAAVGAARPTYVSAEDSPLGRPAIRFPDDVAVAMTGPGSFALRSLTMSVIGRTLQRDGAHDSVAVGIPGGGGFGQIEDYSARPSEVFSGSDFNGNLIPPATWFRTRNADLRVVASDASGIVVRQNGLELLGTVADNNTVSPLTIGGYTYTGAEDIERIVVYDNRLSSGDIAALEAGLRGEAAFPTPSASLPVVLFTGNSIQYGVSVSDVDHDIPAVAMSLLGLPYGSRWLDFSFPGQSTVECTADDPAKLTPYRDDGRLTVVCWTEITNDIYLYGSVGSVAYDHARLYVAAIRAALPGCKVVLTTCLPRGSDYTHRNTCNGLLRAAFPTTTAHSYVFLPTDAAFTDCILADWAAEPTMGPDGAQDDEDYYDAYHIHPNDTGAALLAAITADALTVAGA